MIPLEQIQAAAELIRQGKLVAFPTETVYGLGANALDGAAVARIYEAKGRPAGSPLIVHVGSAGMAREVAAEWPEAAETLAGRYWPGPLTLVLPKRPCVPDIVTAGLGTVGIRVPAHPVALALIRLAGVPIAAPSANRFSGLSPTTAEHVRESLGGAVDLILDGGATDVGIESTVLSLVGPRPVLLRPGMISRREIEELVGPIEVAVSGGDGPHASPGMHRKHYSPRTRLLLVEGGAVPERGVGAWAGFGGEPAGPVARLVRMPLEPASYAAVLYETLHRLDREGLDWIAVERPPDGPEWAGILDRLERAAK
ncbi:MAG TPA: L-threonylcarbamoyladenylate synthase [Bryobacteraceae bacterium]|nr:L-threonylcarbamoyladenylate synthase [Bryobacteraceae bacterium]